MLYDLCSLLNQDSVSEPYALILLHQPINDKVFRSLIKRALCIICADGGANRLNEMQQRSNDDESPILPDAIVGDLDSLSPSVESHYRSRNVPIIHDPDQFNTDFNKSLRYIRTAFSKPGRERCDVVVFGGIGGRIDQGLSQLHHLFKAIANPDLLDGEIFLVSESSISFPLPMGRHKVRCREVEKGKPAMFTENVGVVPLQGPATISLTGFEWDVQNWKTMMGGLISTSNHVKADVVEVECDRPVLFTIEFQEDLKLKQAE